MGCTKGSTCSCLYRASGRRVNASLQSGWPIPCYGWLVIGFASTVHCQLKTLYTGEDLSINLWDLGSGKRIKKMTGHAASIYSLAFSAESSLLVSAGADWTVRCWDVKGAGGVAEKNHTNGTTNGVGRKDHGKERQKESEETYVFA